MTSPRVQQNQLWQIAAKEALLTFLDWIDRAEQEGSLNSPENFAAFLNVSLNRLQIPAIELIKGQEISKAAVSRWISGEVVPSMPTRRHMITSVKSIAEARIAELEHN